MCLYACALIFSFYRTHHKILITIKQSLSTIHLHVLNFFKLLEFTEACSLFINRIILKTLIIFIVPLNVYFYTYKVKQYLPAPQTTSSSSSLSLSPSWFFVWRSVILTQNSVTRGRAAFLTRGWTKFLRTRCRFLKGRTGMACRPCTHDDMTTTGVVGARGSVAMSGTLLRGVTTPLTTGGRGKRGTFID